MGSFIFFVLCLLVVSLSDSLAPASSGNCSASWDDISTSFDVCDLRLYAGLQLEHYKVMSESNSDNNIVYEYYFNIGAQVLSDPPGFFNLLPHQYCPSNTDISECINGNNTISITDNVWAYQIETNNGTATNIFYLSNSNGGPPKWSLINDLNPVQGVTLTYQNGDFATECGKNREFSINFECENTGSSFNPGLHSKVYEYSPCSYTLSVKSLYGCPQECPEINGNLCSAHGLCSFDTTNNKSRCYCFDTYGGNDCSIPNSQTDIQKSNKVQPNNSNEFVHTFETNNVNITYDLSPWIDKEYTILDKLDTNHIYYIGIMQSIAKPLECQSIDVDVDEAFAFQLDNTTKQCYVLGTNADWNLFDEIDDAAHGVTLTYTNGSNCGNVDRQFSVSLVCPDEQKVFDAEMERTISAFVQEPATCKYEIEILSAFACPYQCLTAVDDDGHFDVCSNHGMCVSDPFAGYVRCLCDDQWDGAECQNPPTSSPTVNPTKAPTVSPTGSPTLRPSEYPSLTPTKNPSNNPSVSPTRKPSESPTDPVVVTKVEKVKVNNSAYIFSIIGLCVGIFLAIGIGWYCYKRMKSKHEEFKEYAQFRDNSLSRNLSGSVGFARRNLRKSNVADEYDDDRDDQLL